ncbi:MAG TPA: hypothetical protein VNZ56_09565 [Verrucomicrobiae bacterium]|jgi:hypothetical protein|nr:hypothetical protein [Verrucomicrobiae bacterium]
MESQKVLIMPDRSNRLRREENPPYPEFGIQVLREVLKINEGVGETKGAVKTLESELKTQGERLGTAIKTLDRHSEKLDKIEGHMHGVRGILWFLGVASAAIVTVAAVFELYKYLH